MAEKRIAIMQPYFFPYIGYFQLIHSADVFVIYDNIKYTKRGWINRNRFLKGAADAVFSIPLRKASDSLDIDQREVASEFDRAKLLRQIESSYRRAPFFRPTMDLFAEAIECKESNLFRFIKHSLTLLCSHLSLPTRIMVSSQVDVDHSLKAQDRVLAICQAFQATTYVNAIGGVGLYSEDTFESHGFDLRFIQSRPCEYKQFEHAFVPWLSILDVLMFNSIEQSRRLIFDGYDLVTPVVAGS